MNSELSILIMKPKVMKYCQSLENFTLFSQNNLKQGKVRASIKPPILHYLLS